MSKLRLRVPDNTKRLKLRCADTTKRLKIRVPTPAGTGSVIIEFT